ncbi:hypothetical protein L6452_36825 [Arctium lappa]|uniref:Uncharacterized protein n=1 Tax=Arctium lappa TaxID=4217 RepID=A0ACB8Y165_ARCLA|nr:hypothetical protein L6452_36825 [Arctium lappa]
MTKWFCFLFIFSTVAAADNDELTASLCNTCPPPAICSSPPSSNFKSPPPFPPAVKSMPPHAPPPPRFYYFDSPLAPPPAYISLGGNNAALPPPRLVYFPLTETPPGGGVSGQTNYPYPYFHDSKAANAFSVGFLLLVSTLITEQLKSSTTTSTSGLFSIELTTLSARGKRNFNDYDLKDQNNQKGEKEDTQRHDGFTSFSSTVDVSSDCTNSSNVEWNFLASLNLNLNNKLFKDHPEIGSEKLLINLTHSISQLKLPEPSHLLKEHIPLSV